MCVPVKIEKKKRKKRTGVEIYICVVSLSQEMSVSKMTYIERMSARETV
jgi:hypothetical protein